MVQTSTARQSLGARRDLAAARYCPAFSGCATPTLTRNLDGYIRLGREPGPADPIYQRAGAERYFAFSGRTSSNSTRLPKGSLNVKALCCRCDSEKLSLYHCFEHASTRITKNHLLPKPCAATATRKTMLLSMFREQIRRRPKNSAFTNVLLASFLLRPIASHRRSIPPLPLTALAVKP